MLRGIYISNTGLNSMQAKMNNISNNIANLNTTGYKEQATSFASFKEAMLTKNGKKEIGAVTGGVQTGERKINFTGGSLEKTGRNLDFAIKGEGFFVLQNSEGLVRYTKNGAFQNDGNGNLVDQNGNRVLGRRGPVRVVEGKPDREIWLVRFQDKNFLRKTEDGLYTADQQAGILTVEDVNVSEGYLESSNVNLANNITKMLVNSRHYALNSRVLMLQDKMLGLGVNEIGVVK